MRVSVNRWLVLPILGLLCACLGSELESFSAEEEGVPALLAAQSASGVDTGELNAGAAAAEPDPELVADVLDELDALYADPERASARERQARADVTEGAEVSEPALDLAWLLAAYLEATDPEQRKQLPERDAAPVQPADASD